MLPRGGRGHVGAALALAAVLAMAVAAPAGAAGWGGWNEIRERTDGLLSHVLSWLSFRPERSPAIKCDDGAHPDPNGCPKAAIRSTGPSRTPGLAEDRRID